ncbi:MAG TPA: TolC family protein [Daejeonella sp.]|nr:TolC family protein [Daejeonella sp.]
MKLNNILTPLFTGLILSVFSYHSYAQVDKQSKVQENLSLEQAVQIALENNFDIKLKNNNLEVSKNNVDRGLAGMYPAVNGNFSSNNNIQNTTQTLSSGVLQERSGAKNTSLQYGPVLTWKIFDGFQMFARYDQLKEFQKLGESSLKLAVQTTLADVIGNYYSLVQQKQQIEALHTALEISRIRLKNSKSRYEIGKAAKLEVLGAQVDLNSDTTKLLRQLDAYRTTKIKLNELLARDLNTDFTVSDTIIIQPDLQLSYLQAEANEQNPALQAALISQRIAELNLKQVKAGRYPQISVNTGYNFSRSTSDLGFARLSNGRGFNYGLTASINIFNGFAQSRNEKNAALGINESKLQYEKLSQNIASQLVSLHQTYITNLELVGLEKQNLEVAHQNLDITMEKFKLGSVAPLVFREAQQNYLDASVRYSNAQYQAKLAEITLKQIAGTLSFN